MATTNLAAPTPLQLLGDVKTALRHVKKLRDQTMPDWVSWTNATDWEGQY